MAVKDSNNLAAVLWAWPHRRKTWFRYTLLIRTIVRSTPRLHSSGESIGHDVPSGTRTRAGEVPKPTDLTSRSNQFTCMTEWWILIAETMARVRYHSRKIFLRDYKIERDSYNSSVTYLGSLALAPLVWEKIGVFISNKLVKFVGEYSWTYILKIALTKSIFQPQMHQIAFGGRAQPGPAGSLRD